MRWDDRLDRLFADLEQQAEGLALGERDAEVAEQRRGEHARIDLAARLFASVGERLVLVVAGVGPLEGSLRRVGDGWCLLEATGQAWVVRLAALDGVRGLADRAVLESARPVTARLGLGSALRGLAEARGECLVCRRDGSSLRGTLGRVGADFVDVRGDSGQSETLPFAAVAAVRSG